MKKIFLTGINGFLGSHTAVTLVKEGYRIVGLARQRKFPALLKDLPVEYCIGDLVHPHTYQTAMRGCQAVIHTAALASFGAKDPQDYYRINLEGTKHLLETAEKNGIIRFVYVSTRGVFGTAQNPVDSDESTVKKNLEQFDAYIRSKCMAHDAVVRCAQMGTMSCVLLCPTAMIGSNDERPTPAGKILSSLLQGKVRVYMDGGINIVDVEDVAAACVTALDKGKSGESYILGRENLKLYELFRRLSQISGAPLPKIKVPFGPAYLGSFAAEGLSKLMGKAPFITPKKIISLYKDYSYCSSNKSVKELGVAYTPTEETLYKIMQWFKESFQYV